MADFSTHPDGAAAQPGADEATVRLLRQIADAEATEAAKQAAVEEQVRIDNLKGTGKGGKVTKSDVENA